MSNTAFRVALAVAALALAASSAGVAAASSLSTPSVKTCANKKTGALRVANKCTKSEQAYTLGEVGPTGPIGKTGPAGTNGTNGVNGTNGTNGTNGVVNGFFDAGSASGTTLPEFGTVTPGVPVPEVVATDALPAGSYLLSGTLDLSSNGGTTVECGLGNQTSYDTIDSGYFNSLALASTLTLKSPGTAEMVCFSEGGQAAASNATITAIPVATLTNTTG